MNTLFQWRPPRWTYGVVALLVYSGGWLFVLPDRGPEVDFQFWALIAWYLLTIFFALLGWPSWPSLTVLALVGFSLSIHANDLVSSSQFHFTVWVLASVGCVLLFRKHRSAPTLLLLVGSVGSAIVLGLNAFGSYTKLAALDGMMWTHPWLEWLCRVAGLAMVCLPIALVLFVRRGHLEAFGETTKYRGAFKRGILVLVAAVLVLGILLAIWQRKELISIVRASRMAHQMPGWTEARSKYSAPFASINLWKGSQELQINVRSKRPDLLDSATWAIDLEEGKPAQTWNAFDQEFRQASEVISREKWLSDWKSQQHGRSVELRVKGDRSHAMFKGTENKMNHVWQQFGLKGTPRFYVLARRTGDSSIDLVFNEDGSEAVAKEFVEKKNEELSPHWLDHLAYGTWSEAGSNIINDRFTVITADGQRQSRVYQRVIVQPDDENEL